MDVSGGAGAMSGRRLTEVASIAVSGALICVLLVLGLAGTAQAADRNVRLTLQPSASACTAWDQMDCSYLEVRNGNAPAPDPSTDPEPTFLNMANMPGPVVVDGSVADDGTLTIRQESVHFPSYPTSLENALVGTVAIGIQISASADWTGTYDDTTGEMNLTAPLGLTFKLNCDPVANALCGGIFGAEGNMGTWEVTPKGPVDPLTTGSLTGLAPPVAYGPAWLGPIAEQGTAFDATTGVGTLINNDLEIENLTAADCIDMSSPACSNAGIGNLIAPSLNDALGTVYDPATPANDRDSVPGAIDLSLTFAMSEPPILSASPDALTFPGMNDDGSQPLGTSSAAVATTVTALDAGDIEVRALYTDGGDDSDFAVTNARGCRPEIESGGNCQVHLRFNPSATGERSSTLYASIVSPVSGEAQQVQLATLSGTGGILPKGDRGPAGPLVQVNSKTFIRLRTSARAAGTVASRGARISLGTPNAVRVRIGKHRFRIRVNAANHVNPGKRVRINVRGTRNAVRALRRLPRSARNPTLKIPIRVSSANGRTIYRAVRTRLR